MHGERRSAARSSRVGQQDAVDEALERRVAELAREVLEEAVELVEVAVGDGQERRRVGLVGGRPDDRADVDLQLVAEALDPARDPHEVAAVEAPGVEVGVAEDAAREGARPVAQLDREVRRPGAREEAVLAGAGEDAGHVVAGPQGADRRRGSQTHDVP